jgi:hypothetical protein
LLENYCITHKITINSTKGSSLRIRLVGGFLKFGQEGQHLGDFFGDGRGSGQVVTDRAVSSVIGGPGDGDLLALRSDPVGRSLVGVSCFVAGALLDIGFLAGCSVGSSITYFTFDSIILSPISNGLYLYLHWLLPSALRTSDWLTMVMAGFS